jgi:hypothetical protein
MNIIEARITAMPKSLFDPMPKVYATTEDGTEHLLFEYYPDEISFSPNEFVGLTLEQGKDLRRQKDLKYLQS